MNNENWLEVNASRWLQAFCIFIEETYSVKNRGHDPKWDEGFSVDWMHTLGYNGAIQISHHWCEK